MWLPLFLLWPAAVLIALIVYPVLLVAAIILWRKGLGKTLLLSGPHLFRLFCGLRGLRVDVKQERQRVVVALW